MCQTRKIREDNEVTLQVHSNLTLLLRMTSWGGQKAEAYQTI